MINQENEPQLCYSCDEEFVVQSAYETEAIVSFCPFCGNNIETDEDILNFDEDDNIDEDDLLSDD
jgi:predicted RNA-binding Zn-ribbon protein involved in translation (DUF1610 family)